MNKITFFGVYSKMAKKRIFLIFVDADLNLCKVSQVRTDLCTDLYENWWSSTILWTKVFVSIQKWPKNAFSWFLLTHIWIFVRQPKYALFDSWARIFARIFMKIWLVKYYLMNISFKFHKDPSFHWGDMAKIRSTGIFGPPPWIASSGPPLDARLVKVVSYN